MKRMAGRRVLSGLSHAGRAAAHSLMTAQEEHVDNRFGGRQAAGGELACLACGDGLYATPPNQPLMIFIVFNLLGISGNGFFAFFLLF